MNGLVRRKGQSQTELVYALQYVRLVKSYRLPKPVPGRDDVSYPAYSGPCASRSFILHSLQAETFARQPSLVSAAIRSQRPNMRGGIRNNSLAENFRLLSVN